MLSEVAEKAFPGDHFFVRAATIFITVVVTAVEIGDAASCRWSASGHATARNSTVKELSFES
jgi:hypothetical protein